MPNVVVITGVGRDRVGIVAELTQLLFALGCNLLDSSMTLLRGEFALIVMAELPEQVSLLNLEKQLALLEKQIEMNLTVRLLSAAELENQAPNHNQYIVSVYGADKPGIVARVTKVLAQSKVNITDVETKATGGASRLFVMILEVTAPAEVTLAGLEQSMKDLASEISVDISVRALEVVEL